MTDTDYQAPRSLFIWMGQDPQHAGHDCLGSQEQPLMVLTVEAGAQAPMYRPLFFLDRYSAEEPEVRALVTQAAQALEVHAVLREFSCTGAALDQVATVAPTFTYQPLENGDGDA